MSVITSTILSGVRADFASIKIANGYNTDIVKSLTVEKELREVKVTEFDCFYSQIVGSTSKSSVSGKVVWTVEVGTRFFVSVNNQPDGGLIEAKLEKLKSDIVTMYKLWITDSAKTSLNSASALIDCTTPQIYPYFDRGDTAGVLDVTFTVRFIE